MNSIHLNETTHAIVALQELSHGKTIVHFKLPAQQFDKFIKQADFLYESNGKAIAIMLSIYRLNEVLTIQGVLSFSVNIRCAICLTEVERNFELPLKWTLLPIETIKPKRLQKKEEIELSTEDLEVSFYRNDKIDLTVLIHELLILEMETSPRCELDTCKTEIYGAPPERFAEESAARENIDPRWASLAALKGKLRKK